MGRILCPPEDGEVIGIAACINWLLGEVKDQLTFDHRADRIVVPLSLPVCHVYPLCSFQFSLLITVCVITTCSLSVLLEKHRL